MMMSRRRYRRFEETGLFGFLKSKNAISEYNTAASIIGKIVIT